MREETAFKKRHKAQKDFEYSFTVNYNNLDKNVRDLKALMQTKLRSEYWKYIELITTSDDSEDKQQQYKSMKRFWRFNESKTKDFKPVGPLTKDAQTANAPGEKPTTDNWRLRKQTYSIGNLRLSSFENHQSLQTSYHRTPHTKA